MSLCLLIPAYKPTTELTHLLNQLLDISNIKIVVINDGSPDTSLFNDPIFQKVTLLHHAVNRGKGSALKTGFNYALLCIAELYGCITLDADGQHTAEDIKTICEKATLNPTHFILGVRDFDATDIPLRSRFGNKLSSKLWYLLTGTRLQDTQTGLRYVPKDFMQDCLQIEADRYEFETEMLLLAHRQHRHVYQIPIQTVYIEHNASSHFNPVFDSLKIYFALFRFAISGLLCTGVDYLIYGLLIYKAHLPLTVSFILARAVSLGLNFQINRKAVFNVQAEPGQFLKYLSLSGTNMLIGYLLLSYMTWDMPHFLAKFIVDLLLFVLNFFIQREFIFKRELTPS